MRHYPQGSPDSRGNAARPGRDPALGAAPSLVWEVKKSFRDYVTGVGGIIETATPASVSGEGYRFPRGAAPAAPRGAGSVLTFCGTVTFSAHQGLMRLVVADPQVHLRGRYGQLSIAGGEGRIVIADLEITGAARHGNLLYWAAASARLADDGAAAFDFHYPPGTELSPVSFSWSAGEEVPAMP